MDSNPGHYVAVMVTANAKSTTERKPARYLKLLRPHDALVIGQVYRLVSFEDVLREFGSKRRVRLTRLLAKPKEAREGEGGGERAKSEDSVEAAEGQQEGEALESTTGSGVKGRSNGVLRQGQWRPTLQTIAEIGN
ncbi:uncharacterized protein LOC109822831 [Asparagus officinalis]|uniref:uncharacterized protein LOC109822831 n=1 Tax=Asparagus officinalis TaxID=4686 RepID=UPI00098DF5E9|nr:uncharacterized protein LOC109822831 [Asparagus officinalis]